MNYLFSFLLFIPLCSLFGHENQELVSFEKQFFDVTHLEVRGPLKVLLFQGEKDLIFLDGSEKDFKDLKIQEQDGHLVLTLRKNSSAHIQCKLFLKQLHKMTLKQGATLFSSKIYTSSLDIQIKGDSDAQIAVESQEISSKIFGSGHLSLEGEVDDQKISISGTGKYVAKNLKSKNCTIKIRGSAEAFVDVSEALDVDLQGYGKVVYSGNPTSLSKTGTGEMKMFKERIKKTSSSQRVFTK